MATRRRPPPAAVPERLCRFLPDEWPEADVSEAFARWKAERHAWAEENPGPGPLGDGVDRLRFELETRRRLAHGQGGAGEQA